MLGSCIELSHENNFICNCGAERVADKAMEYSSELLDRGEFASVVLLGTPAMLSFKNGRKIWYDVHCACQANWSYAFASFCRRRSVGSFLIFFVTLCVLSSLFEFHGEVFNSRV